MKIEKSKIFTNHFELLKEKRFFGENKMKKWLDKENRYKISQTNM